MALRLVDAGEAPLECLNPMSSERHLIMVRDGDIVLSSSKGKRCPLYQLYSDIPLYVARCTLFKDGIITTIICDDRSLRKFYRKLEDMNIEFRIISVRRLRSGGRSGRLSREQLLTLMIAHRIGYFDVPSKASIRDVAKVLGKSPSTVSELIKRGIKNLLTISLGISKEFNLEERMRRRG